MKKILQTFALLLCGLTTIGVSVVSGQATGPATPSAQQPDTGITPNRIAGEVTAIDQAASTLTVKADGSGSSITVMLNDKTAYYRAKSDALQRAEATKITPADLNKIALAEISVGERIVVLGKVADDRKSVPARVVIATTKADIAKKHETDREQWQQRGIVGQVAALNPETKEITVNVRTREGQKPIIVAAGDKVLYRRYAADSVKFADAKPGAFAELQVGDQLRALGERSADGTRFTPEEIVSGSFRQVLGTVVSVNPASNEIKMTGVQDKQPFSVVVNNDTSLRRLPPQLAMMLAMRAAGGGNGGTMDGPGGGGGGGRRRPSGEGQPPIRPPAGGGEPGAQGGGPRRMGGGPGGGFDAQDLLERLPAMPLAELKPGDMIVVSSTNGADPSRLNAIALIAGVDAIINAMAQRPPAGPGAGANLGLPAGIDFGIGLP
ncbi:MAG: hypothetical protein M3371_14825 [Acidobacteriota bacterium]|nr:hypothetical protein [Acidobacteriota bacterium]